MRPTHLALLLTSLTACGGTRKLDEAVFYEQIEVRTGGGVSFVARSPALRPSGALRVQTADSGRSWAVSELAASPR